MCVHIAQFTIRQYIYKTTTRIVKPLVMCKMWQFFLSLTLLMHTFRTVSTPVCYQYCFIEDIQIQTQTKVQALIMQSIERYDDHKYENPQGLRLKKGVVYVIHRLRFILSGRKLFMLNVKQYKKYLLLNIKVC